MSIVPEGFVGTRRVQEHGGSKQVVIPAEISDRLGIQEGDELVVKVRDGEVVLAPPDRSSKR